MKKLYKVVKDASKVKPDMDSSDTNITGQSIRHSKRKKATGSALNKRSGGKKEGWFNKLAEFFIEAALNFIFHSKLSAALSPYFTGSLLVSLGLSPGLTAFILFMAAAFLLWLGANGLKRLWKLLFKL